MEIMLKKAGRGTLKPAEPNEKWTACLSFLLTFSLNGISSYLTLLVWHHKGYKILLRQLRGINRETYVIQSIPWCTWKS